MEHRRLQHTGISPSRAYRVRSFANSDLAAMHRARQQGNGHFIKQMSSPMVASDSIYSNSSSRVKDSFDLVCKQSSFEKSSVTRVKEISKQTECRTSSPSVIAKLMGLDELPPPQVRFTQQRDIETCSRNSSFAGFQENYMALEDNSHRLSTGDHQEFKDVFEIMETSNDEKHKSQPVRTRMSISKHIGTDMGVIEQRSINIKNFSAHETLQKFKRIDDPLDVEDFDRDQFQIHPESHSLFTKHHHRMRCSPHSSIPSHTTLKSSKDCNYGGNGLCIKSEKKAGRCTYLRKDVIGTFGNPTTGLFNQSFKEHGGSSLYNFPKSENVDNMDMCLNPTQIVLLKPGLDNSQNMPRIAPSPRCCESCQFGYTSHTQFWTSGCQELYAEGRGQQKLFANAEVLRHTTKGSREIAREITKQMRNTISSSTRTEFTSKFNRHIRDGRLSKVANLNNYKAFRRTSYLSDDWNSSYNPPSYSDDSYVTREARKRLSERWRTIHNLQGVGPFSKGSNTLAEMLALSDREGSRKTMHSWVAKNVLDEKQAGNEACGDVALETKPDHLGFDYRDDEAAGSIYLPSVFHPASSTACRSPKSSSRRQGGDEYNSCMLKDVINLGSDHSINLKSNQKRSSSLRSIKGCNNSKSQSLKSGGVENDVPIQDINGKPEEWRSKIGANNISEKRPTLDGFAGKAVADAHLAQYFLLSEDRVEIVPPLNNQNQAKQPTKTILHAKNGTAATVENNVTTEEKSYDQSQADSLSSHCEEEDSDSFLSLKGVEQSSPVSVLESPTKEEKYNLGCFESVASGLPEHQMQLELLKLESEIRHAEESEEDGGEESQTILQMKEIFGAFRDEEDRDFSYLLDMLVDSGIRGVYEDRLFYIYNSLEYPVGSDVFERLEKKYGTLETWSKSERKLLFDLINSSLAEILVPLVNVQPWLGPKRKLMPKCSKDGLVEELWQMVIRQRKEVSVSIQEGKGLDLSWFGLGDDVNNIGREIEGMLLDDILEELVSAFFLA